MPIGSATFGRLVALPLPQRSRYRSPSGLQTGIRRRQRDAKPQTQPLPFTLPRHPHRHNCQYLAKRKRKHVKSTRRGQSPQPFLAEFNSHAADLPRGHQRANRHFTTVPWGLSPADSGRKATLASAMYAETANRPLRRPSCRKVVHPGHTREPQGQTQGIDRASSQQRHNSCRSASNHGQSSHHSSQPQSRHPYLDMSSSD